MSERVLLHDGDEVVETVGAELLHVREQPGAKEDLVEADLVLVLLLDAAVENQAAQALQIGSPVVRAREHVVPLCELVKRPPRGIARAADPDRLEHAARLELAQHEGRVERPRGFCLVWLDAPDVVRVGRVDRLLQLDERRLEDRSERGLLCRAADFPAAWPCTRASAHDA